MIQSKNLCILFWLQALKWVSCQQWEAYDQDWRVAAATWYGEPEGDGSDGGACGYGRLKDSTYGSYISAGSAPIFKGGLGCGACYMIRCINSNICTQSGTRVVITDECPGGNYCGGGRTHFDLSGTAFGQLAVDGKAGDLRNMGVVDIQYKRVPCLYPNQNITFQIGAGSTPYWLDLVVRNIAGPGNLQRVSVLQENSMDWLDATHIWGANWAINHEIRGSLSVQLSSTVFNTSILISNNSIPAYWQAGDWYDSQQQFTT